MEKKQIQMVTVVMCYGNLIGLYANNSDAQQVANECIMNGQSADILIRPIL